MPDPLPLLARLVRTPGLTGREADVLAAASHLAHDLGLRVEASADGLILRAPAATSGPALCFCSHLDVVPPGEGWSVPPHEAVIWDDVLWGRGAVDARASCLAILLTVAHFAADPKANIVGVLSVGEEGFDPTLPRLLSRVGPIVAAVVGEPTKMDIATSQRGLLVIELRAHGVQGHAARVTGELAIPRLVEDLVAIGELNFSRIHPTLGGIRVTPTRLNAGIADNATPPVATALLDVRTTPLYSNDEIVTTIAQAVRTEVRVVSDLWIPCETPPDHRLVHCAQTAIPSARRYASDAASDWTFLARRGVPAVKCGPGDPAFSHGPDERISRTELEAGVAGYIALAEQWLAEDVRLPEVFHA